MRKDEYTNMANLDQSHWFFLGMRNILLGLLDSFYARDGHISTLDAGAGTGWLALSLTKYGTVTALDINEEALAVCAERGVTKVILADVAAIPEIDETYDLVVCSEVLYHQYILDENLVMKEFFRILKPGGRVLIKVPAHMYLWGAHDTVNLTRHRYEPYEVRALLERNGFVSERVSYANFFLYPLVYLKRKLERSVSGAEKSDIQQVSVVLNQALLVVLSVEAHLIRHINLPQGSSIIGIGVKPKRT